MTCRHVPDYHPDEGFFSTRRSTAAKFSTASRFSRPATKAEPLPGPSTYGSLNVPPTKQKHAYCASFGGTRRRELWSMTQDQITTRRRDDAFVRHGSVNASEVHPPLSSTPSAARSRSQLNISTTNSVAFSTISKRGIMFSKTSRFYDPTQSMGDPANTPGPASYCTEVIKGGTFAARERFVPPISTRGSGGSAFLFKGPREYWVSSVVGTSKGGALARSGRDRLTLDPNYRTPGPAAYSPRYGIAK